MRLAEPHTTGAMWARRALVVALVLVTLWTPRVCQSIELRRGPYLLNQRPDGITVRWRTSEAVRHTSVLRYGDTPNVLDHAVAATAVRQHFPGSQDWEATVDGLDPGTRHYYAVEGDQAILAGADDTHTFWTGPSPDSETRLRFWVVGDSGANRPREGDMETVLAMSGPTGPVKVRNGFRAFNQGRRVDGMILLGDNAYPWGSDVEYQTAFFGLYADELRHVTLWPAIGNHDMDGAYRHIFFTSPRDDAAGGHASKYYYSFDVGNAHFVVLDAWKSWWEVTTDPTHVPWVQELAWLEADLAATDRLWTVVACHFPVYCDGNYDSDTNGPLKLLREALVPVLDRHGVDLYLAGHDHTYQRSYLIRGHTGTRDTYLADEHLVSRSSGRDEPIRKGHGPHTGTVYIVSGTGSGTRPTGDFQHPVMVPFQTDSGTQRGIARPGSFVLEIEGALLEGWQVDDTGLPLDHFRVSKVAR
jgi:acid phosphatase type 7